MNQWVILKRCHYSNFIPCIKRWYDGIEFKRHIVFTDSCKYWVDEESCVNKLFGFSFGLLGVHKNSVRFGWRYNGVSGKIEILEYYYRSGRLIKNVIGEVRTGEEILCSIKSFIRDGKKCVSLYLNNRCINTIVFEGVKKWLLTLGFYFGGDSRAPHKMVCLWA